MKPGTADKATKSPCGKSRTIYGLFIDVARQAINSPNNVGQSLDANFPARDRPPPPLPPNMPIDPTGKRRWGHGFGVVVVVVVGWVPVLLLLLVMDSMYDVILSALTKMMCVFWIGTLNDKR